MKFLVCLGLLCVLPTVVPMTVVTGLAAPNATEVSNEVEGIKPESNGGALKTTEVDGRTKPAGGEDVSSGESRAFRWGGCRFLFTSCGVLNALNPFTASDCCIGSCMPRWTRDWYFVEWRCSATSSTTQAAAVDRHHN